MSLDPGCFDEVNELVYAYADLVKHGEKVKVGGQTYDWMVARDESTHHVLISYRVDGSGWEDDAWVDEVPNNLLSHLITAIKSKIPRGDNINNPITDTRETIRVRATRIHQKGDPVKYILYSYNKLHVGDREVGLGILTGTGSQSTVNSKGLQSKLTGESGFGKTHAARTMVHLHPQDYVLYETLSDQALYHMQDELKPGMIIFSDDVRISEGLEDVIKRSTTNFQSRTTRRITVKEGSRFATRKLEIPERIIWLLTSVDDQGSEQLVNRQIGYDVDESDAQDEAVLTFETQKAVTGQVDFPETEEVLTCRELIRIIKEDKEGRPRLFNVVIPFADRIVWNDKKNRRNYPIFLDMVRAFAVLRFMQRNVTERRLIATEKDFEDARRLYVSRAGMQSLHITEKEKEFLMALSETYRGEADTSSMQDALHVSDTRVRRIADRLLMKYPRFKVEKRTVYHDDGSGKTATSKNFYILDGKFTLEDFEAVVWLKEEYAAIQHRSDDNQGPLEPLERHSNPTRIAPDVRVKGPQNEALEQKEDSSNNNSSNNSITRIGVEENKREIGPPVFSPAHGSSDPSSNAIEDAGCLEKENGGHNAIFQKCSSDVRVGVLVGSSGSSDASNCHTEPSNIERVRQIILDVLKLTEEQHRGEKLDPAALAESIVQKAKTTDDQLKLIIIKHCFNSLARNDRDFLGRLERLTEGRFSQFIRLSPAVITTDENGRTIEKISL